MNTLLRSGIFPVREVPATAVDSEKGGFAIAVSELSIFGKIGCYIAVSYTHLTLPTIYSV